MAPVVVFSPFAVLSPLLVGVVVGDVICVLCDFSVVVMHVIIIVIIWTTIIVESILADEIGSFSK